MALASLNLAVENLAAWAESLGALIPAKAAAIPVVAGLAIGTAAGATYVAGPSSEPAARTQVAAVTTAAPAAAPVVAAPVAAPSAAPAYARPCDAQTWPYLEARCMSTPQEKRVRIVSAPRPGEATDAAAKAGLVSRDTVLRQPQNLDAIPPAKAAPAPREKRKGAHRSERRLATQSYQQSYQVPSESRGYPAPVIVVRPMRLDAFR
jgi:hypothetical protein